MVEKIVRMRERLSAPGPGRSVASATEQRAAAVRQAVSFLEVAFNGDGPKNSFLTLFGPRWDVCIDSGRRESVPLRAAWALVNVWVLARIAKALGTAGDFAEAERWFLGGRCGDLPSLSQHLPSRAASEAIHSLEGVRYDDDFFELLPYILEPHGPGSRLSVMRDPTTRKAREAKRESGVFYTPSDVAEYMIDGVARDLGGLSEGSRWLDPACGTGVYLVALLRKTRLPRLRFAANCVYGIDLSPLAVEICAFVLLHHCLRDAVDIGIAPWAAWHALRMNLATADALRVGAPNEADAGILAGDNQCRTGLRSELLRPDASPIAPVCVEPSKRAGRANLWGWLGTTGPLAALGDFFPEVATGFEALIGNPPYAPLGDREDGAELIEQYGSLKGGRGGGSENTYPLFIEMMWRLTRPGHNASALVVPLSIAFHQGRQYRLCRQSMASQGGGLRCAFFDREPHALFGEDVKTRNAILFRRELEGDPPRGSPAVLKTGPLQKWTSRTRERLFASISFTLVSGVKMGDRLPKLAGEDQAAAYSLLSKRVDSLSTFWEAAYSGTVPLVPLTG